DKLLKIVTNNIKTCYNSKDWNKYSWNHNLKAQLHERVEEYNAALNCHLVKLYISTNDDEKHAAAREKAIKENPELRKRNMTSMKSNINDISAIMDKLNLDISQVKDQYFNISDNKIAENMDLNYDEVWGKFVYTLEISLDSK
ncbi:hypothetical protein CHH69_18250, partial [Terribacillus saccharophilus]|uniref:hypothetical protein n=1 Tax=Terribacillus saccharophilus TaxID=361277 RepID=UPI000BD75F17